MQVLPKKKRITAIQHRPEPDFMWLVTIEDYTGIVRRQKIASQGFTVRDAAHKNLQPVILEPKEWRVVSSPLRPLGMCCARDWQEDVAYMIAKRMHNKIHH